MQTGNNYSLIERLLHRLAFHSRPVQTLLEDMEQSLYSKEWQGVDVSKPVFVTSLPRAGTTVLLESMSRLSCVATHTYRDMPFILTPVIWHKLSGPFQKSRERSERAHGDGLMINEDSPEAFEEVLFKHSFADEYKGNFLTLYKSGDGVSKDFQRAMHEHMQKIIQLRSGNNSSGKRYVSKNNANIARIPLLQSLFPEANIVLVLRDPFTHAMSLHRQHRNFLKQHSEDAFIKRYMADIGHYEFGELHKPIAFPGMDEVIRQYEPASPDYWLAYWIAAFDYLAQQPGLLVASHEAICESPRQGLATLCQAVAMPVEQADIAAAAACYSQQVTGSDDRDRFSQALVDKAQQVYERLYQHRVND